jgi:hypothetical protein
MTIQDAVAKVILQRVLDNPDDYPSDLLEAARAYDMLYPDHATECSGVWDLFKAILSHCVQTVDDFAREDQ